MATKLDPAWTLPSLIDIGVAVINQEASALSALAATLDSRFDGAVRCIATATNRVAVTGLGKSGHIARKIASTLSATGTPATFVHAAEAGHGDLGMIVEGDVLIALSNSGETAELKPIISRAIQIGVPIVAIASRQRSFLLKAADYGLLLPEVDEACPHGTAPTSSTTMMMALGDALAIGAMRARGTTLDDIARLHPAGSIGHRLAPIETVLRLRGPLPAVRADAGMAEAVVEMTAAKRGAVCVLDEDDLLVGIITDGDVRRSISAIQTARCSEVMTREPLTVREGMSREDAYHVMHSNRVNVVVVVARDNPRKPLGIVHIHDLELIG